jgi:hypothetical protein
MARQRGLLAASTICLEAIILFYRPALAFDLNGMWATDTGACDKIFAIKEKQIVFREDADMFGSGFIVDADQIRGRTAKCKIIKRRTDGSTIHMMSSCATDIMLSDIELSLKVITENQIDRIFPGFEGSTFTYFRCPSLRRVE